MRKKRWNSRKEYLQWYMKRYNKAYKIKNRERLNQTNKRLRQKKGKIPREVWISLLKDRQVWVAMHNGLSTRDNATWRALLHEKAKDIDLRSFTPHCLDCRVLFAYTPRCSRNPKYCRGCWGSMYLKKIKSKKNSLLYSTKMI